MITPEMLRKYMNQSQPFQIFLADGRQIDVPHGEYLSLQPGGRMFVLWTKKAFEVFNLTMVTSIRASGAAANEQNQEK
jgi:hypothetical protein